MKLTLQITASASTLAALLSHLPNFASEIDAVGLDNYDRSAGNGALSAAEVVEIIKADPGVAAAMAPPAPLAPPAAVPAVAQAGTLAPPPLVPAAAPINGDDDGEGEPNAAAPDVDAAGMPWDERIHASTKATIAGGFWRKKRGVDAGLVAQVEGELRGAQGGPVAMPAPIAMPAIPMQVSPAPVAAPAALPIPAMPASGEPAPTPPMQAAVEAAMALPTPVAASPDAATVDFPAFMQHMGDLMKRPDAGITPDYLADVTARVSQAYIAAGQLAAPLGAITDIAATPSMVPYTAQVMAADGKW